MACDGTIHTYTGKRYMVVSPKPDMVDVRDTAHHLSNLNRFTGATRHHYSVAQHAWLCSFHVHRFVKGTIALPDMIRLQFYALHHDDSEAYVNDLSRPVKYTEGLRGYRDLEALNWAAICLHFDIPYILPAEVKAVDDAMCCTEGWQLLNMPSADHWSFAPRLKLQIKEMSPRQAEQAYLARHYELLGKM